MRKPGAMIVVSVLLCASLFALTNRSAVSLTGSDLATCTVPDPCRTFDVAISKPNAGGVGANGDGAGRGAGVGGAVPDATALNSSGWGVYVRANGMLAPATAWIDRSMSAQNLAAGSLAQVGGLFTISNSVTARNSDGFR